MDGQEMKEDSEFPEDEEMVFNYFLKKKKAQQNKYYLTGEVMPEWLRESTLRILERDQ